MQKNNRPRVFFSMHPWSRRSKFDKNGGLRRHKNRAHTLLNWLVSWLIRFFLSYHYFFPGLTTKMIAGRNRISIASAALFAALGLQFFMTISLPYISSVYIIATSFSSDSSSSKGNVSFGNFQSLTQIRVSLAAFLLNHDQPG